MDMWSVYRRVQRETRQRYIKNLPRITLVIIAEAGGERNRSNVLLVRRAGEERSVLACFEPVRAPRL
jgi:hypothetical protein